MKAHFGPIWVHTSSTHGRKGLHEHISYLMHNEHSIKQEISWDVLWCWVIVISHDYSDPNLFGCLYNTVEYTSK